MQFQLYESLRVLCHVVNLVGVLAAVGLVPIVQPDVLERFHPHHFQPVSAARVVQTLLGEGVHLPGLVLERNFITYIILFHFDFKAKLTSSTVRGIGIRLLKKRATNTPER